jgi:hypothetical protein
MVQPDDAYLRKCFSSWNVCMPDRKINTEVQAEAMNMLLENI